MVIRAKRLKPRRKVAREFAQLQDLQKEDRLGPEGVDKIITSPHDGDSRDVNDDNTSNWGQESSSEKGTSTDDPVCSLMSFPNGNVQKVHESPEMFYDTNDIEVQCPEGQTIGVKRKSLTTKMNPSEKPKARRRNPEGGNG